MGKAETFLSVEIISSLKLAYEISFRISTSFVVVACWKQYLTKPYFSGVNEKMGRKMLVGFYRKWEKLLVPKGISFHRQTM